MKIDTIARLFSLNSLSSQAPTNTIASSDQASRGKNSEAVKIYADFGKAQAEPTRSERQEKVASLKKQIADGSYAPNSQDVANAVARELFT